MIRDIRTVLRHLGRERGYTLSVILTMALAVGANTAIFSAMHAVLLRPLPLTDDGRTVVVWQTERQNELSVIELTYRHLREWRDAGRMFTQSALVATHTWDAVLDNRGDAIRLSYAGVSAEFFQTLGVVPHLGRGFEARDDVPNAAPVIVLHYDAWQRYFDGDPTIVGRSIRLDGESIEVVGVMPRGFDYPHGAAFWRPAVPIVTGGGPKPNLGNLDTFGVFYVVGRLRPGLDVAAATREIDAAEAQLDAAQPGRLKWGDRAVVEPLRAHLFGAVQPALWTLWAAVTVLLLIAVANVSGVLLTRASVRRRELSLRRALGASVGSLARLWLVEVGVLTGAGGLLGLALAGALSSAITRLAPDDVPRLADIAINPVVVGFTVAVIAFAALVCGLAPMREARRANTAEILNEGGRATAGRRSLRMRSALLVGQLALAVMLLAGAGLVVRSFANLRGLDLGFQPGGVLSVRVDPQLPQPPNQVIAEMIGRIEALPGVEAAGAVFLRPLALGPIGQGVRIVLEGQPQTAAAAAKNPTLNYQTATPGFFTTMRVPLRRGRLFTAQDTGDAPRVAIVSESTTRALWPGQDPLGKRVFMSSFTPGQKAQWRTIVGVVADVRYRGLDDVQLDIYDPALQVGMPARTVVLRTDGDPSALAPFVRARVREIDPAATVDDITTMDAVVARATAPWRMSMWLFTLFAGIAVFLAAVGLFSLVSLDVAARRRELALRMALGASPSRVVGGVLGRIGWKAALGIAVGVAGAIAASRAMGALLYEVEPVDAPTYALVVALIAVIAVVAAWIPARRAVRINPMTLIKDA